VPMLRNFLGSQMNVTKGSVDETVPCEESRDEDLPPTANAAS
jgi:hypothetical protein